MDPEAERNRQTIREFFEIVWNQGNEAAIERFFAPDLIDHVVGGRTRFHALWSAFQQGFPGLHFRINDLIAEKDRVVARLTISGTHGGPFSGIRATGLPVEIDGFVCFRMRAGKIVERWAVLDEFRLLQQIGVLPGGPRRT